MTAVRDDGTVYPPSGVTVREPETKGVPVGGIVVRRVSGSVLAHSREVLAHSRDLVGGIVVVKFS